MSELKPLLSLVCPWFGGHPQNLRRTIESVNGICDHIIVVHQKMFDDDTELLYNEFPGCDIVVTDWNEVIQHGYGGLPNMGNAKPWRMLLGVGETVAQQHKDIRQALRDADYSYVFQCNHHNDIHRWNRIWSPHKGNHYSGLIHEDVFGNYGGLLFRMQDTDKLPLANHYRNDVLKWFKACSYNILYRRLLNNPEEIAHTDRGWLEFVKGAADSINAFCDKQKDMVDACIDGDREKFIEVCRQYTDAQNKIYGVNLNKLGEVMSE